MRYIPSFYTKNIRETTEYLELFLRNLLLGETNELKNRYLHVRWKDAKQDIQGIKQDIGDSKQDIQNCYDTNKKMHFEFKYKRR